METMNTAIEDDVMAARVVSPESELQRIIVRPRKNSKTQS
jgi:hypothetical protein